jgi:outer membrane lipoprotein-sorting protein
MLMTKPTVFLVALFVLSQSGEIKTSEQLVRAMHDRYTSSWYKTLTFEQETKQYDPNGRPTSSTWYEALSLPGRLRIEMDSARQRGVIFARDSQYVYRDGKLMGVRRSIHPLLLLGFDLYFLPVQETLAKLKESQFDLSVLRADSWQGRPVYVVGAKKGDSHSPQFWIDKERLYFVRLLQPGGKDGLQTQEAQFNKYTRLAGGWISREVVAKVDGKVVLTEEYSNIKAGGKLDSGLFDPEHWGMIRWR